MKISTLLRKALTRPGKVPAPDRAHAVEDQRALETAKAWERPGGPIDPGFVA